MTTRIIHSLRPALLLTTLLLPALPSFAQKQELGLTLGGILSQDRTPNIHLTGGTALQANYAYRFWSNDKVAIQGEVHFLANGQRKITSANPNVIHDVATLYVTPGIRVKFAPNSSFSPYVAAGGGYSLYEHSHFNQDGITRTTVERFKHGGVFDFGAGADVKLFPADHKLHWIGLRGEIRDFVSGNPLFGPQSVNANVTGRQHNVVIGGGFVLKWGN